MNSYIIPIIIFLIVIYSYKKINSNRPQVEIRKIKVFYEEKNMKEKERLNIFDDNDI